MTNLWTDDSLVCIWLKIVFPSIRNIEEKVQSLPERIKKRVAELVEDIPGDYGVAQAGQEEIRSIYSEHLHLVRK